MENKALTILYIGLKTVLPVENESKAPASQLMNAEVNSVVNSSTRIKVRILKCNGNGYGIYIPHFLYVYIQMRFTFNHPTHES